MSEPLEVLHRFADNSLTTLKSVGNAAVLKFRDSERCLFALACCSFGAFGSHPASAACGQLTMDGNTSWGPYRLESGGGCTNGAGLLLTRDAHPVVDEAGGDECVTNAQVCETPEGTFAVVAGYDWSAVVDLGSGAKVPGLEGMAWTFLLFSGGYMIVPYQDSPESSSTKLIRLKPGPPISVSLEADGPMEISVLNADSAHFEGGVLRFEAIIECDAYGWTDFLGDLPPDCMEGKRPARLARQTYSLELDKMDLRLDGITDESVRRQRLKKLSEKKENANSPNGLDVSRQTAVEMPAPKIPSLAPADRPKQVVPEGFPGSEIDPQSLLAKGWTKGDRAWTRLFPEFMDTYNLCPDGKTVQSRLLFYLTDKSDSSEYRRYQKSSAAAIYANWMHEFEEAGYTVVSSRLDSGFNLGETLLSGPNGRVTLSLTVSMVEAKLPMCP